MALLKIQRAGQITLPAKLRQALSLTIGDYLEAEAVPDGILLKPMIVVDRGNAWQRKGKSQEYKDLIQKLVNILADLNLAKRGLPATYGRNSVRVFPGNKDL